MGNMVYQIRVWQA